MMFDQHNYLAILAAAVAAMMVGGIWYMPQVMGAAWMTENGLKQEDLTDPKPAMLKSFIAMLILAFGLSLVIKMSGTLGWQDGAVLSLMLGVLIHGAGGLPNYAFERRSMRLYGIHMGSTLIGMTLMGAILGIWQ